MRDYGLPLKVWQQMFDEQGGVCAICKKPETAVDSRTGKAKRLGVDHCHRKNTVRGLLCSRCNVFVGHLEGNLQKLVATLEYLRRPFAVHEIPYTAKFHSSQLLRAPQSRPDHLRVPLFLENKETELPCELDERPVVQRIHCCAGEGERLHPSTNSARPRVVEDGD